MRVRLERAIDKLNKDVIQLGALVEQRLQLAMKSLESGDIGIAERVVDGDKEIDQKEVDIEEECLKILALHQPVADYLRYIVAVLKLNNDLERIGDLAVNIAKHSKDMMSRSRVSVPFDYFVMAEKAQKMVAQSLDALVNRDLILAYKVCADDDAVDAMKKAMMGVFTNEIRNNRDHVEPFIDLYLISRNLERIADHATNIAEDVIYMITGEIHRHRGGDYKV